MTKTYSLSLHIFRRDLRLEDNTGLIQALDYSEQVIPCFIFDKRQIEENAYKSQHALQFMASSLKELDTTLRDKKSHLYCFYGIAEEVIKNLTQSLPIEAIFINRDYTPFSRTRDAAIETICQKQNINFHYFSDALLHEPEEVLKPDGKPYTVFTHAFKKAQLLPVRSPQKNSFSNYYSSIITLEDSQTLNKLLAKSNPNLVVKGGRQEALSLLNNIPSFKNYETLRNIPIENKTTHLSTHHKFGTISIRETYQAIQDAFNSHHTLVNELYWRDFFTHIGFHFPHVFGQAFHQKYDRISWDNNETLFRAWCDGQTGFPIVDAGMRELNTTGYMHNRVRMITASFLCKDLHIDWRWGEKYFAEKLTDYDPAVNNGNWQWAASTGCDAQPYFRIFNPWLQQAKFDADCLYIKKWIPELARLSPNAIHALNKQADFFTNYPRPIVDHTLQSAQAKALYQQASTRQ